MLHIKRPVTEVTVEWEKIFWAKIRAKLPFFFVRKCHVASGTLSGQGPRGYTTEHRINLIRGTKHDPLCSVGARAGPEQNAWVDLFFSNQSLLFCVSLKVIYTTLPSHLVTKGPQYWLQEAEKSTPGLTLSYPLGTSQVTGTWPDDPAEEFISGCQCVAVRSLFFFFSASVFSTIKWK